MFGFFGDSRGLYHQFLSDFRSGASLVGWDLQGDTYQARDGALRIVGDKPGNFPLIGGTNLSGTRLAADLQAGDIQVSPGTIGNDLAQHRL